MSSCLQSQGICPHVQVISLFSITNPLSSSPGSGSVIPINFQLELQQDMSTVIATSHC